MLKSAFRSSCNVFVHRESKVPIPPTHPRRTRGNKGSLKLLWTTTLPSSNMAKLRRYVLGGGIGGGCTLKFPCSPCIKCLSDGSNNRGLLGLFACSRQLLQCKLYHFRGLGDRTTRMLKPSAWPAGIYLRAAWLGQVVTVSWILDTSLTKTKTDPQTRTQLVDFFFRDFLLRCSLCVLSNT